jgi:Predicted integral membrane protein (DUF2269)
MYDTALFLHLVGVAILVVALSYTLGGLFRAQRATSIGGIRSSLGFLPVAEKLIPVGMLLILAFGLYMVGKGHWGWGTGWVDVAIAIFVLMSVLGPAVESKRTAKLHEAVENLPDGPIPPEVEALRRDPVLTHVALFGSWQIVAFLYLMTNKPGWGGAIAACAIAAAISVPLARLALRPPATAAIGAPEPAAAAETASVEVQI